MQEAGLLYNLVVPAKKPGAYQLRIAVRDTASERTGSASQYVEVPDVKKGQLVSSDLHLKLSGKLTVDELADNLAVGLVLGFEDRASHAPFPTDRS